MAGESHILAQSNPAAAQAVYDYQAASLWRGVPMDKCAQDVLLYQEMIHALKPDVIIETGTWHGGSGLFLADMCALNGRGEVLSIDVDPPLSPPRHPRLTFLQGDSIAHTTLQAALDWAHGRQGLVILDSDHQMGHVLAELNAYAPLVAAGSYLIVEDSNVNGHPVRPDFGPGPREAVEAWIGTRDDFVVDRLIEPFISFAPGGYLRRVR